MPTIRPAERSDVPQVASLYEHVARSGSRTPPAGLADYFERTFFDHPWVDPEIPSLVYAEDDRVVGFLGSSVRRFEWDGRPIRLGVSGQLVTEPHIRSRAAGVFLMKRYLDGPQDFSLTDTAGEVVRRIWERLGGDTYHLACIGWIRVFRPVRFAGEFAAKRRRRGVARLARGVARPLDAAAGRTLRRTLVPPETELTRSPLTGAGLAEHLPALARGFSVYPRYDAEFVSWLFDEIGAVHTHGSLITRLVSDDRGEPVGTFAYYSGEGRIGSVLQVAARDDALDVVLDALFADAYERGVAGLQGRLEGVLREPLARKGCRFHQSGFLSLVHARDPALLRIVHAGRALLTRLEGEWWMGHHLEPFETATKPDA